jgi:hypothetical protein
MITTEKLTGPDYTTFYSGMASNTQNIICNPYFLMALLQRYNKLRAFYDNVPFDTYQDILGIRYVDYNSVSLLPLSLRLIDGSDFDAYGNNTDLEKIAWSRAGIGIYDEGIQNCRKWFDILYDTHMNIYNSGGITRDIQIYPPSPDIFHNEYYGLCEFDQRDRYCYRHFEISDEVDYRPYRLYGVYQYPSLLSKEGLIPGGKWYGDGSSSYTFYSVSGILEATKSLGTRQSSTSHDQLVFTSYTYGNSSISAHIDFWVPPDLETHISHSRNDVWFMSFGFNVGNPTGSQETYTIKFNIWSDSYSAGDGIAEPVDPQTDSNVGDNVTLHIVATIFLVDGSYTTQNYFIYGQYGSQVDIPLILPAWSLANFSITCQGGHSYGSTEEITTTSYVHALQLYDMFYANRGPMGGGFTIHMNVDAIGSQSYSYHKTFDVSVPENLTYSSVNKLPPAP